MRDYIYIWNDPTKQCIVASGIEFRDISERVGLDGGVILLCHYAGWTPSYANHDEQSRFDYVPCSNITKLAEENVGMWGDFIWADYVGSVMPAIPGQEIAELMYFAHIGEPLGRIALPTLGNRLLCYIHDDGWYLRLFYSSWSDIEALIGPLCPQVNPKDLQSGSTAHWISGTSVEPEEKTLHIDTILNRRFRIR
jgi:hypothetical protein